MESGLGSALSLIQRSVSIGTWASYSRAWQEWESILSMQLGGSEDFESTLLYWVGSSYASGVSHSVMGRRLSALAFWFKLRNLQDFTKTFLVRQAMQGFRRGMRVRDGRRPVSYELLLALGEELEAVCLDVYEACLFRAAFALAFFGALRISELVSPSRVRAGGLLAGDVVLGEHSVECRVRRSKTDQLGKGVSLVLQELRGSPMCPLQVLRAYLELRPGGQGPLLMHCEGWFLSIFQFVQVFRKCLERMGKEAKEFSSHSFRIGAATKAARWGLPPDTVRRIGRWESDRYKLYVRPHLL